jgi:cerevisin
LVKAGVHVSVAAGNEREDACLSSPSSAKLALTVGATDVRDTLALFSNTGPCVDGLAPGVDVSY